MPERDLKWNGREPQDSAKPLLSAVSISPNPIGPSRPFLEASDTVALPKAPRRLNQCGSAKIAPESVPLPDEIISSLKEHNLLYVGTLALSKGSAVVRCTRDAMDVAVKITSEVPTSFSGAILEARLQSLADHPHILPVVGAGFLAPRHQYAIFPYLNGSLSSLRSQVAEPQFENTLLVHSIATLSALHCVHEMGMVHRDVKPSNILLAYFKDVDGQPQSYPFLSDFGIAKPLNFNAREELCQLKRIDAQGNPRVERLSLRRTNNAIRGTPGYLSPEQARGEEVDRRSDIFSMGVLLYTGYLTHNPYQVDSREPRKMITKAATKGLAPIQSKVADIDPEVAGIIDRAIAFRREDRFQTADEMAAALGRVVRGRVLAPCDAWSATVESLIFNQ